MKSMAIPAALAAVGIAACGAIALGLAAPAQASQGKVCFRNGTDQEVYFRFAIGTVTIVGSKRMPGIGACFHVPDIRELRVGLEKKSPVLCRITPRYGLRYELTSLRNCTWRTSPA